LHSDTGRLAGMKTEAGRQRQCGRQKQTRRGRQFGRQIYLDRGKQGGIYRHAGRQRQGGSGSKAGRMRLEVRQDVKVLLGGIMQWLAGTQILAGRNFMSGRGAAEDRRHAGPEFSQAGVCRKSGRSWRLSRQTVARRRCVRQALSGREARALKQAGS
jgi:hypothetical protein